MIALLAGVSRWQRPGLVPENKTLQRHSFPFNSSSCKWTTYRSVYHNLYNKWTLDMFLLFLFILSLTSLNWGLFLSQLLLEPTRLCVPTTHQFLILQPGKLNQPPLFVCLSASEHYRNQPAMVKTESWDFSWSLNTISCLNSDLWTSSICWSRLVFLFSSCECRAACCPPLYLSQPSLTRPQHSWSRCQAHTNPPSRTKWWLIYMQHGGSVEIQINPPTLLT